MTHMMKGTDPQKVKQDIQKSLGSQANQAFTNLGGTSSVSATSALGGAMTSGTNPQEVRNQIQQSLSGSGAASGGSFNAGTQANKVRQDIQKDLNQSK